MRHVRLCMLAGLLSVTILNPAIASELIGKDASGKPVAGKVVKPEKKPAATCSGDFGTSLVFEDSPSAAARKAKKEQKLVMVLHVSGHFEDPRFT